MSERPPYQSVALLAGKGVLKIVQYMGKPVVQLSAVQAWDRAPAPEERALPVSRAVASLTPYEAANVAGNPDPDRAARIFKLDWNESTIAPSPRVRDAIQQFMLHDAGLNWYPELGSPRLTARLSDYTGVSPESILVTNGSDEALALICNTYLDPDDVVVVPVPTYNHFFVFAQARGADIRAVKTADPFTADIAAVRRAMVGDVKLVYLVSPNNPTGATFDPREVAAFCRDYPRTLVLLDEAYYEFSRTSGIDLVAAHDNLVVTRTFSKAFGLAGLRVGYLAAGSEIIEGLRRIYNSKSVNTLAQVGACAALEDLDYLNAFVDEVATSRAMVCSFFAERGLETHNTSANFVVVRFEDVAATVSALVSHDIYVRDRSDYPGMAGCLRMTVGNVDQTTRLLERLQKIF